MNELFLRFLSLTLSGSLVVLPLLLLQPVLQSRVSRRWQYLIWWVPVLRLLLPWNPSPRATVADLAFSAAQTAASRFSGAAEPSGPLGVSLLSCVAWVWLAVALVLFLRRVVGYLRLGRAVRQGCRGATEPRLLAAFGAECTALGLRRRPGLVIGNFITTPMLVGLVRPAIALPAAMAECTEAELRLILTHELVHYRRGDVFFLWATQLALCLHWFNPLVWLMAKKTAEAGELACDEEVICTLDADGRRQYGQVLLAAAGGSAGMGALSMSEDGGRIKERLDAILHFTKRSRWAAAVFVMVAVVLVAVALTAGVYAANAPTAVLYNPSGDRTLTQSEREELAQEQLVERLSDSIRAVDGVDGVTISIGTIDGSKWALVSIQAKAGAELTQDKQDAILKLTRNCFPPEVAVSIGWAA